MCNWSCSDCVFGCFASLLQSVQYLNSCWALAKQTLLRIKHMIIYNIYHESILLLVCQFHGFDGHTLVSLTLWCTAAKETASEEWKVRVVIRHLYTFRVFSHNRVHMWVVLATLWQNMVCSLLGSKHLLLQHNDKWLHMVMQLLTLMWHICFANMEPFFESEHFIILLTVPCCSPKWVFVVVRCPTHTHAWASNRWGPITHLTCWGFAFSDSGSKALSKERTWWHVLGPNHIHQMPSNAMGLWPAMNSTHART